MRFIDLKIKFKDDPILDLRNILNIFGHIDRRRLYEWQKKGYIKKITNNYYFFSDTNINDITLKIIANKIYHPSYIGLELALSYYNLIPEAVFQITGISTKKTKTFNTNIAQFSYKSIHKRLFWGYNLKDNFFVSDPEKTILDYFYLNPHLNNTSAFYELRLNKNQFKTLINYKRLKKYLKLFSNNHLHQSINKLLRFLNVKF
jgi:predicted transcriptional regulator of viral defense system